MLLSTIEMIYNRGNKKASADATLVNSKKIEAGASKAHKM